MRAVLMQGFGGPEVLRLGEIKTPEPGPGEAGLAVAARDARV